MCASRLDFIDRKFFDIDDLASLVSLPIHIVTPDGIIRFVNDAWCQTYGHTYEEVVGRHIHDAVYLNNNFYVEMEDLKTDFLDSGYMMLKDPIKKSAALVAIEENRRVSMVTINSTNNYVLVTSTPIYNDENKLSFVVTVVNDLTMASTWNKFIEGLNEENDAQAKELAYLRANLNDSTLLGNSRQIAEIRKLISIVAPSDATVLIRGDSGTGKEVVAKEIHFKSERASGPFISVNCAAIPENLLESELFGHEKGAFTGAVAPKVGLFEMANHGTILLDEIGEFPLSLQPKLLRVLQERELRKVGGTKNIPIDVRVISATNRDLGAMVKEGKFRTDLYYRLNVFPVNIPPLKDRREDIAPLATAFLGEFNKKYKKAKFFTPYVAAALERYGWPGNVRELENIVERLVIVGNEPAITIDQLKYIMDFPGSENNDQEVISIGSGSLKDAVDELEKKMIKEAYSIYKSTYKVAEVLQTSQSTVVRKMRQLGINTDE